MLFKNFDQKSILDLHKVNNILERNITKRTQRSQKGLFHGKQSKSGKKYCYSDKRNTRRFGVNVRKKYLQSDILKQKIHLRLSTKAIRCIDKYGGLDNYILLTRPKKMDSLYGEYLRRLMMYKLQDSKFNPQYIAKSKPVSFKIQRRHLKFQKKLDIWQPTEIRYTDLTQYKMKLPEQMSRRELEEFKFFEDIAKNPEKMDLEHPLIKRENEKQMKQLEILEVEKQKINEKIKKYKSKKILKKIDSVVKQGQEEFASGALLK
ncbi:hypothetical protein IMG5_129580 [Ichthyophthirius multifiliis]|uniref:Ribosomal protein L28 n=1 Tax=Ichthyophthirius multifiliis TaxID=5932 RepID=G0QW59_ICHMU|nr:hypothetical protein IMG5_129580 [Ichthyophthirius multifiliis]EGR30540.1 hypothetical protein IMG5_129580 [Ichthyophthirius multifiliis]|eukprot:XP_004032127.1 hypothetical protein IMG5_129580 [Ichthyophthirius multifiliis]